MTNKVIEAVADGATAALLVIEDEKERALAFVAVSEKLSAFADRLALSVMKREAEGV